VVVFSLLTAPACGYKFAAGSALSNIAAGRPVRVEPFQNRTTEAEAAILAVRSVQRAVAMRSRLGEAVTAVPGELVAEGTVEALTATPVNITGPQSVGLWVMSGRISIELREPQSGKVVARSVVADSEQYVSGADIEGTEVSRRLAMSRLMEKLGAMAVDRLAAP